MFGSDDDDDGDDDGHGKAAAAGKKAVAAAGEEKTTAVAATAAAADDDEDLDDLLGDVDGEGKKLASPVHAKKKVSVSVAQVRLPDRVLLPPPSTCMAVKMPNCVKIQPDGFDLATFNADDEVAAFGGVETVIRWRVKRDAQGAIVYGADGQPEKESNARMVKLSDGTFKLVVGDATFNASINATEKRYAFAHWKTTNEATSASSGGAEFGDVEAKPYSVFECAGILHQNFLIKPDGVGSHVHNKMTRAIKEKYTAHKRSANEVEVDEVKTAPDALMAMLAKREEEESRRDRKLRQQEHEGGASYYQSSSSRFGSRRPAMSAAYLDGDEADYDDVNITALKKGAARGKKDKDAKGSARARKAEVDDDLADFIDSEDDESVVGEYMDDDDDDDEDGGGGGGGGRKKKKAEGRKRRSEAEAEA